MSASLAAPEDAVTRRAREIAERLERDPRGLRTRRVCQSERSKLRALFRRNPALFSSDAVGMLQSLSSRLKTLSETGGADAHAAALAALQESFGYSSFRPGQESITTSGLAAKDPLAVRPRAAGKPP